MSEQHRVVPMRLFANWEVDRAAPNSVPRLVDIIYIKLICFKSLYDDVNAINTAQANRTRRYIGAACRPASGS